MTKWLFICFLALTGCDQNPKQPVHLKNIPNEVFWIGNKQGGYWYLVHRVHPHKNNADITIYSERDKKVIISKRFFLICTVSDEATWITDPKSQILGFDGKRIKFKSIDGKSICYLQ
jgi:hypothetical protein